ncbi:unnamed protein product [Linum tenue]|uniref:Uncharacterized protein n=1 Tax=Linum tenue TaxID=586396 RepID=A0AAV0Q446_9ROSI|nr:unnamed protein product [Linum tenue]
MVQFINTYGLGLSIMIFL